MKIKLDLDDRLKLEKLAKLEGFSSASEYACFLLDSAMNSLLEKAGGDEDYAALLGAEELFGKQLRQ